MSDTKYNFDDYIFDNVLEDSDMVFPRLLERNLHLAA